MSEKHKFNRVPIETNNPSAKKIKSEKTKPMATIPDGNSLESILSDCVKMIFDFLPRNDTGSLNRAPKHTAELVRDYFQQKYWQSRLEISTFTNIDGRIDIDMVTENGKFNDFKHFIRNIKIVPGQDSRAIEPINLFESLRWNCCQNLFKLILSQIDFFASAEWYGEFIRDQLQHLEHIEFDRCYIEDVHCSFLKHCQKLKSLAMKISQKSHSNALFNYGLTWIYQRYSTLTQFRLHVVNGDYFVDVDEFFKNNPQIKEISMSAGTTIVKSIIRSSMKLRKLTINGVNEAFLDEIHDELHKYCGQLVERLIICCVENPSKLSTKQIQCFGALEAFQGFQFWENDRNLPSMTTALKSIQFLKSLSIELYSTVLSLAMLENIVENVPALESFHLDAIIGSKSLGKLTLKQIVQPFAERSKNLKEFALHCVPDFRWNFSQRTDLFYLDAARSNYNKSAAVSVSVSACAFVIYLNEKLIQEMNFIVPVNSLIIAKPISTVENCYCLSHPILYW